MKYPDPIAWEASLPIRPSSPAWRAAVRAIYGSELTEADRETFLGLSGGVEPPEGGALDVLVVAGRRGGKSETLARCAVFEACYGGHGAALAPGQVGLIPIVCPVREQAQEVLRYVKGLAELPQVRPYVERITADGVEFKTRVAVRVMTADAVSLSGYTVVGAAIDEAAKLPGDESTMPDAEIERSLRPALAPVRGAPPRRLIRWTSAYLESGVAYGLDRDFFGQPDAPTLVLKGTTETFNPNIDRGWLARERKRDPMAYAREYECEWQSGIVESWFGVDAVDRAADPGRGSMPWQAGGSYHVAIDPAFSADRFAVAVGLSVRGPIDGDLREVGPRTNYVCHVDAWAPPRGGHLSPEECVRRVVAIADRYGTERVYCDQFAAIPLGEAFERHGLYLIREPWTATNKAPRFRAVREAMADGFVRLPDDAELAKELKSIRGRLMPSGGERIEAARGHDDRVSAIVLALSMAMAAPPSVLDMPMWERRARARHEAQLAAALGCPGDVLGLFEDEEEDEASFLVEVG